MQHAAPARPLPAAALSALLALTAAACSTGGREADRPAATAPATVRSPAALPQATAGPLLTRAQARAALITEADLGAGWEPTRGAATWRDGLLKAGAEPPDCGRLLDVLYTEDLFGADTAPRAATALDEVAAAPRSTTGSPPTAPPTSTPRWPGSAPCRTRAAGSRRGPTAVPSGTSGSPA